VLFGISVALTANAADAQPLVKGGPPMTVPRTIEIRDVAVESREPCILAVGGRLSWWRDPD